MLLVTHDLPYALELCPRAVVLDRGQVVADGATREVLADEGFMRAHRLMGQRSPRRLQTPWLARASGGALLSSSASARAAPSTAPRRRSAPCAKPTS